jgi:hypothetical protein
MFLLKGFKPEFAGDGGRQVAYFKMKVIIGIMGR